jgi:hypothetical protein
LSPTFGAYAGTVTQHVAGTPTEDDHGNEVPGFTNRTVRVFAQYPGNSVETDTAATDRVVADMVIVVQSTAPVSASDEFTLSDTKRYRVEGQPERYANPFTGSALTQVNLRRIT